MAQISQDELRTLAFCDCWHDFGTHFKQMKEYVEKEKAVKRTSRTLSKKEGEELQKTAPVGMKIKNTPNDFWNQFVAEQLKGTIPEPIKTGQGEEWQGLPRGDGRRLGQKAGEVEDYGFFRITGRDIKTLCKRSVNTTQNMEIDFDGDTYLEDAEGGECEGGRLFPCLHPLSTETPGDTYVAKPLTRLPEGYDDTYWLNTAGRKKRWKDKLAKGKDWRKWPKAEQAALAAAANAYDKQWQKERDAQKKASTHDFDKILPDHSLFFVVDTSTPSFVNCAIKSSSDRRKQLYYTQIHETLFDPATKLVPKGREQKSAPGSPVLRPLQKEGVAPGMVDQINFLYENVDWKRDDFPKWNTPAFCAKSTATPCVVDGECPDGDTCAKQIRIDDFNEHDEIFYSNYNVYQIMEKVNAAAIKKSATKELRDHGAQSPWGYFRTYTYIIDDNKSPWIIQGPTLNPLSAKGYEPSPLSVYKTITKGTAEYDKKFIKYFNKLTASNLAHILDMIRKKEEPSMHAELSPKGKQKKSVVEIGKIPKFLFVSKRLGDQGQALACKRSKLLEIPGKLPGGNMPENPINVFVTLDRLAFAAALAYRVDAAIYCFKKNKTADYPHGALIVYKKKFDTAASDDENDKLKKIKGECEMLEGEAVATRPTADESDLRDSISAILTTAVNDTKKESKRATEIYKVLLRDLLDCVPKIDDWKYKSRRQKAKLPRKPDSAKITAWENYKKGLKEYIKKAVRATGAPTRVTINFDEEEICLGPGCYDLSWDCNQCSKKNLKEIYHCNKCEDFDVCKTCKGVHKREAGADHGFDKRNRHASLLARPEIWTAFELLYYIIEKIALIYKTDKAEPDVYLADKLERVVANLFKKAYEESKQSRRRKDRRPAELTLALAKYVYEDKGDGEPGFADLTAIKIIKELIDGHPKKGGSRTIEGTEVVHKTEAAPLVLQLSIRENRVERQLNNDTLIRLFIAMVYSFLENILRKECITERLIPVFNENLLKKSIEYVLDGVEIPSGEINQDELLREYELKGDFLYDPLIRPLKLLGKETNDKYLGFSIMNEILTIPVHSVADDLLDRQKIQKLEKRIALAISENTPEPSVEEKRERQLEALRRRGISGGTRRKRRKNKRKKTRRRKRRKGGRKKTKRRRKSTKKRGRRRRRRRR